MVTAPARGGRGPEGRAHSRHDGRHPSAAIRPGSGPDAIVAAARDAEALGFADILGRDGARVCGAPRAEPAESGAQGATAGANWANAACPTPGGMGYGRSSEDSIYWDTAAPGRRHRSLAVCGLSHTPQGLSGREASSAEGREQPSDGTYHKGGAKSPGPGQSGDDDGPVLGGGIDGG